MRVAAAIVALACGLAAAPALSQALSLGEAGQRGPAQPSRDDAARLIEHPDVNQGRFVAIGGEFGSLRTPCTQCHQADGAGDASGAFPRLTGQSAWYLYGSLRNFADGSRQSDVMTPIAKELTDGQMQDVAAYYASLEHVPHAPQLAQDKQAVQQGQAIAQAGTSKAPGCDSCHGAQGIGNPPLYPYLAGQSEAYLRDQLQAFKAGKRKGDPMGIMRDIAKQLSDQQISDVAAYYASLAPQEVARSVQAASGAGSGQGARNLSPEQAAEQNAASNAESVQRVGATPNPQPQKGNTVVPGGTTGKPQERGKQ